MVLLFVGIAFAQENQKRNIHFAFEIGEFLFSKISDKRDTYQSFKFEAIMTPIKSTVYSGYRINLNLR